ncbi:MAG: hypothetical protein HQM16_10105 [Deltaproteobacteria bacterium]|nr:hypothetical protein [Deltaproteobacteria bacterium]
MMRFTIIALVVLLGLFFLFNNMHQVRLHLFLGQYVEVSMVSLIIMIVLLTVAGYYLVSLYIRAGEAKRAAMKSRGDMDSDDI